MNTYDENVFERSIGNSIDIDHMSEELNSNVSKHCTTMLESCEYQVDRKYDRLIPPVNSPAMDNPSNSID